MIAVVLDRSHARFFDVTEREATELSCITSPATRGGRFHSDRHGSPGQGERTYDHRKTEEARRHFAVVARHLAALTRARPADGILIAGPGTVAAVFRRALPAGLAQRVIGAAKLTPTDPAQLSPQRVHDLARAASERDASARVAAAVTALLEGLGKNRATNGPADTLRALGRGRVRTLLVRGDVHGTSLGAATKTARRQKAEVLVVRDPKLASRIDGIAALLRF
jgi:peptide subunit release factor 1 (eRF1)